MPYQSMRKEKGEINMSSHTGSVIKGGSFLIDEISFDQVCLPGRFYR